MAVQKEIDLNLPLDANAEPVLKRTPLHPSLATAALTLHGDYYRQLQSKANSAIVWHPFVQAYIYIVFAAATVYIYSELYEISDTWGEFVALALRNKYFLTKYFPPMIFVAGLVGILSFTATDDFKTISDKLATDLYMALLFRFPLRIYANAEEKDMKNAMIVSASESTDIIEYRNAPIAVVTVVPMPNESTSDTFYAKITGLHVRKAYRAAGVELDLLDSAREKAMLLSKRYVADNKLKAVKTVLLVDSFSFDQRLTGIYQRAGFTVKSSTVALNAFSSKQSESFLHFLPAKALYKHLGISRLTLELEVELADLLAATTSVKSSVTKAKSRKR